VGYVGCVTGACLARDGHQVIGVDTDASKIAELNAGTAPISEPGLSEMVAEQVRTGRLRATNDVEASVLASDIVMVCVGTPSTPEGAVSARGVKQVVASIGAALAKSDKKLCVVIRSTLLPGILDAEIVPMLEQASGRKLGEGMWLCNNPEFLRESTAIHDYDHPPFVLIGADDPAAAAQVEELYRSTEGEVIVTDPRTAAMVKYACNAFHALKVAFANEIGAVSQAAGADGRRVMELLCRDRKLNISEAYLRPGFAFGGSCLPKDLRAVIRFVEQRGLKLELLPSILPSNELHVRRALAMIARYEHHKVGLVGLSFKRDTDDLRESPLVTLAESLIGRGYEVKIYDPCVRMTRLRGRNLAYVDRHLPHLAKLLVQDQQELLDHASLLVLGSNVAQDIDWQSRYTGDVLDLRKDLAVPGAGPSDEVSDVTPPGISAGNIRH
jgi:GDP-mannose 6-dehydrogenase